MTEAPEPPNAFRVFMMDGTSYDFYLTVDTTWERFVQSLVTKDFMATQDIFIQRESIVRIQRIYPGPTQPTGQVIDFPTKGSA